MSNSIQIIILSGGKGTRLEGMDLPKPLCTIGGKSLLYRVLDSLPAEIKKISLFYSETLEQFQFQRTVLHSCGKVKDIDFVKIPIETRGPVETAYVGIQKSNMNENAPILVIDNDTINIFSLQSIQQKHLGLGTFFTQDPSKPYSFVKTSANNRVVEIKEKEGISNEFCTGLYYFPSAKDFLTLSDMLFHEYPTKKEYFISDLYAIAIKTDKEVYTFPCEDNIPLGTKEDIAQNISKIKRYPTRYCFDIDNTLVTYSSRLDSKEDIKPIPSMVNLLRKLHEEGNTIILHTARGMATHNSNLGLVMKKSAIQVLECLEKFAIPYDEIYFGKPHADIYIDDKAWNPYTNAAFQSAMFNYNVEKSLLHIEKGCSNNENTLYKKGQILIKEGPRTSLDGEIFFYKSVEGTELEKYFPRFIVEHNVSEKSLAFEMEFVQGTPVSKLFRNFLLTKHTLEKIVASLKELHETSFEKESNVDKNLILSNYIDKLNDRIKTHKHYASLPQIEKVGSIINTVLQEYINSERFKIAPIVLGDPWFDNMIYTSNHEIKFLDMKGKLGSFFTLQGDSLTDYAKLYQSILGFDFYLHKEEYTFDYEQKCRKALAEVLPFPLDDPVFEAITACIVCKTFYYFSDESLILPIYKSLGKMKLFSFLT